ncbi:MAG: hypothetical protein IJ736_09815 [Firmicutes bacterium]|nr:hypothetical protein [Bacillota bacterium]
MISDSKKRGEKFYFSPRFYGKIVLSVKVLQFCRRASSLGGLIFAN